ncbi:MAG: TIGR02147 family protein [Fibrobacterales bacterium]
MINIYDYDSNITYLNDWFKSQKEGNKKFSHQFFAHKAGLNSRSYMANILNGSRCINAKNIFKIAEGLGLVGKEVLYFETLVYYSQCIELKDKGRFFLALQKLKPKSKVNHLKSMQYEYFQKWYYPALRELLTYYDFGGDYKILGQQILPAISGAEAKRAVQLLLDLQLIEKIKHEPPTSKIVQNNKWGLYRQTEGVIFGDDKYESMVVRSYQENTLDLAKKALSKIESNKQSFNTYTYSVDSIGAKEVDNLIQEFQEKLISIVNNAKNVNNTYQLNLQLFPLTKD